MKKKSHLKDTFRTGYMSISQNPMYHNVAYIIRLLFIPHVKQNAK